MRDKITCAGTDIVESIITEGSVQEIQCIVDGRYSVWESSVTDLITREGHEHIRFSNGKEIPADNVLFIGPHFINNPFDSKISRLVKALMKLSGEKPLIPWELSGIADISMAGKDIGKKDPDMWVSQHVVNNFAKGGYGEDRDIYSKSEHFGTDDRRTIHLGLDVWTPARTPVLAPLDATIHSFNNNDNFGDYGPTIILEHQIEDIIFYTLHGHLTKDSLPGISRGDKIGQGEEFALIGDRHENGNWYPHVHTQIIADLMGYEGDFPGVARNREAAFWMSMCPNPQYLFKY